jgi:hypothetical protein
MAGFTAQLIAGSHPRYKDGIIPIDTILLSENSRPAWVLNRRQDVTWIPTLESPLEEAFLIIGLHCIKDKNLRESVKNQCPQFLEERVECYGIPAELREKIYKESESLEFNCKVILSIFRGSLIRVEKAIETVRRYKIDIEICPVVYCSGVSPDSWSGQPAGDWTADYYRPNKIEER